MWYAIIAEDMPNSLAKRLEARSAHLARLQALQARSIIGCGATSCD